MQSEAFDAGHVYEKINEFLKVRVVNLTLAQGENFTQFVENEKAVLKSVFQRKEPTLDDRTTRLWKMIRSGQLTFDMRQRQIELLDSNLINATSVMKFYTKHILDSSSYHKMIIVVNGKDKNFQPNVNYPLTYTSLPNCPQYPDCP